VEKVYARDDKLKKVRLQALRRQYELLAMTDIESMSQYFGQLINLTNQMRKNGETLTNLMKIEKVLRTPTSRFDHTLSVPNYKSFWEEKNSPKL